MGFCSSVAPSLLVRGKVTYAKFPEWLGKNSSQRKAMRLIRELKAALGHKANFGRKAIQYEAVPVILEEFLKMLKDGDFQGVIDYMDEYRISKEMYGEHLMGLCTNPRLHKGFESLDTQTKSAFTRLYNKSHDTKKVPAKKGA